MQFVTKKEAVVARLAAEFGGKLIKLTDPEVVVGKVMQAVDQPFNTPVEKEAKRQLAEDLRREAITASSGNLDFAKECAEACFSQQKLDALLTRYPRVHYLAIKEMETNPFVRMYTAGVSFEEFQDAAKTIALLGDIVRVRPKVNAYIHTPFTWDLNITRELAATHQDPAFYGVVLPQVVQNVVDRLLTTCYRHLFVNNYLDGIDCAEFFRRAQVRCPEGITFSMEKIVAGRNYRVLHIHRTIEGLDTPVTNSFVMS